MFPRSSLSCLLVLFVLTGVANAQPAEAPAPAPAGPPLAPGYLHEAEIFGKVIDNIGDRLTPGPGMPKDGFYPEFGYMITGSGWISLGPGYHHKFA